MGLSVGDRLPEASLLRIGAEGPEDVALGPHLAGRKVVIFGLPGAFTRTCSATHLPSFIRTRAALAEKGIDEVICIAVNDPFVMQAWGDMTGATAADITMLADAGAAFTKSIGMDFTAPPAGFYNRSRRYALMAEDGIVKLLNIEETGGTCEISAGETLVGQL
jgi:glutaredoxin/glutathione-dependent peroxiredoxin